MKKMLKALAGILVLSMVIPMAGCGKSKKQGEVISKDDLWYSPEVYNIGESLTKDMDSLENSIVGATEDTIVVSVSGQYRIPEDTDLLSADLSEFLFSKLYFYGLDGTLKASSDISEKVKNLGIDSDYQSVLESRVDGDNVVVSILSYKLLDGTQETYDAIIDVSTGEIISCDLVVVENVPKDANRELQVSVGEVSIGTYYYNDDNGNPGYIIGISDSTGAMDYLDLRTLLPEANIYNIDSIIPISDTKAALFSYTENGEEVFEVDLTAKTVNEGEDIKWLTDEFSSESINPVYVEDLGLLIVTPQGISTIDFESKTTEEIFSFDNTSIYMDPYASFQVVSYSEEQIIITGTYYEQTASLLSIPSVAEIIVLNKAEENPNEGKTILELAIPTTGDISPMILHAVVEYNNSSASSFIKYDRSYVLDVQDIDFESEESINEAREKQAGLSNQMMIDIMSGEGPDLILNCHGERDLMNEEYLLNLKDSVPSSANANIISLMSSEDKLFNMPLSYGLNTIVVESEMLEADQNGLTYDEYNALVSDVMNGEDIFGCDRQEALRLLLPMVVADLINEDGSYNFDQDSFRQLALFVKESFPDQVAEALDESGNSLVDTEVVSYIFPWMAISDPVTHSYLDYPLSFLTFCNKDYAFLGLPSDTREGISVDITESISISALCPDKEGALSFLELLMSDDIQNLTTNNPISDDTFREMMLTLIDEQNYLVGALMDSLGPTEAAMLGLAGWEDIEDAYADQIMDIVASTTGTTNIDSSVSYIISEEMGAYFNDTKTLDETISIINDRVQTYISERK